MSHFSNALAGNAPPSSTPPPRVPLTFTKALAQIEKGHFRHADGKFRVGKPVPLADLEDIDAAVPDDDAGLIDAIAKFTAGEVPPPIDIAVDPEGQKVLIKGKKRLAAARATGQATIPVRFTEVAEPFGKAENGDAWKGWHGHVRQRSDGVKMRCGGPAICTTCKAEQEEAAASASGGLEIGAPVVPVTPPRTLQPIDDKTSFPPFPFDQTVFSRIRPDQVPRFLGVLTDPDRWPLQAVKLADLIAMQNRLDTAKTLAKVESGGGGHEPIVVMLEPGRLHIADGHHDLAAAWLRGEDEKDVRFADLTAISNVLKSDMPVAPGTTVQVKEAHRADNWFLERVGDAVGEVIASWVVAEGDSVGKVGLAVEWLTPGISGLYRGLDAAKVEMVSAPADDVAKALALPAVGDIIDFDDDRFVEKGPASGPVAAVIQNTVVINFGDGRSEDLEMVDWVFVTKNAKTNRLEKPSGKVVWSVFCKPKEPQTEDVEKAGAAPTFTLDAKISKVDDDQRLVFGWFSIVEIDGQPVTDREGDRIAPPDLEKAAYGHVLNARVASDTHVLIGVGNLVESCVFTVEKQQAMQASLQALGIPAVLDLHCVGWWGGYHITSDKVWAAVKAGDYVSFSIGGNGTRTPAAT